MIQDDSNFQPPGEQQPSVPPSAPIAAELVDGPDGESPQRPVGHPIAAWCVILLLAAILIGMNMLEQSQPREQPAEAELDATDQLQIRTFEIQSKVLVAQSRLPQARPVVALNQARELSEPLPSLRLRYATLAGELAGPERALKALDEVEKPAESSGGDEQQLTSGQQRQLQLLRQLYRDYRRERWEAPSLTDAEKNLLHQQLGWFGGLALAPEEGPDEEAREQVLGAAQRTMYVMGGLMFAAFTVLLVALAAAATFVILIATGQLRSRLAAGSPFGAVFAETFALWLAFFFGLGLSLALLIKVFEWELDLLLANTVMMLSTLITLGWLRIRGASFSQIRREVGLNWGQNPLVEIGCGVVGYLATLPLLIGGVVVMLVLMFIAQLIRGETGLEQEMPKHPMGEWLVNGDPITWFLAFLVAAIVAPLVEEIMFRGLLYRHLRDATARWRMWTSILASALLSSLVFAIIHPQGVLAVPVLMALASGFALMREWRGSLIAPITAHAIHNGSLILIFFLAMHGT